MWLLPINYKFTMVEPKYTREYKIVGCTNYGDKRFSLDEVIPEDRHLFNIKNASIRINRRGKILYMKTREAYQYQLEYEEPKLGTFNAWRCIKIVNSYVTRIDPNSHQKFIKLYDYIAIHNIKEQIRLIAELPKIPFYKYDKDNELDKILLCIYGLNGWTPVQNQDYIIENIGHLLNDEPINVYEVGKYIGDVRYLRV